MKKYKPKLIFTQKSLPFILLALGKTTDKKGYVIDIKTKQKVLDYDAKPFKSKHLIGVIGDTWITKMSQLICY